MSGFDFVGRPAARHSKAIADGGPRQALGSQANAKRRGSGAAGHTVASERSSRRFA